MSQKYPYNVKGYALPSPGLRPPSPHPMGRGQGEGCYGARLTPLQLSIAKYPPEINWVADVEAG